MIYLIATSQAEQAFVLTFIIKVINIRTLFIFIFSLGEAYGKEGLLSKCGTCFKTAEKIYRVVPGDCHPFYTDVFMPLYKKYVTIASAVMEFGKY